MIIYAKDANIIEHQIGVKTLGSVFIAQMAKKKIVKMTALKKKKKSLLINQGLVFNIFGR